ncbi:plasmid SOS inhibition protein A [Klebsiella pneumoniae]|nr:plasmid SOS inhibition protein A [Klebsiella pneumoniae]
MTHHWRLRQNLLGQAVTGAEFPVTGRSAAGTAVWERRVWTRVSLPPAFWHWRSRYASLASLDRLRDAGSRCVVSSMKSASL